MRKVIQPVKFSGTLDRGLSIFSVDIEERIPRFSCTVSTWSRLWESSLSIAVSVDTEQGYCRDKVVLRLETGCQ